jgi:hypothetical protein
MKERDVRGVGEEQRRLLSDESPASGQSDTRNVPEPPKRAADDEWLAFAAEDPAFFIKPSDAV